MKNLNLTTYQTDNCFYQPNTILVTTKMIDKVLSYGFNNTGDLIELYCGVGTFSMPLATSFDRVFVTLKIIDHQLNVSNKQLLKII